MFVILDETNTFIGNHEVNNLLKSFATQVTINIERKGMESYTINSYINNMIFTNNEAPIKLEENNRRYNLYDVDNRVRHGVDDSEFNTLPEELKKGCNSRNEYFAKLRNVILHDNDAIRFLIDFFMNINLTHYKPNISKSNNSEELREMSKNSFELFCDVLKGNYELNNFGTLNSLWTR